jgi:hypothetical protein
MKFLILLLYVLNKFRSFFFRIYSNMYNVELELDSPYFLILNAKQYAMVWLIMILSLIKENVIGDKCLIKYFIDLLY